MALKDRFTTPEGINVVLWEPLECEKEMISHLSDLEIEELAGIRAPQRQTEFIAIRRLVKQFIGSDKCYTHTTAGAPILADRSFELSVSHTAGCIALAWHPTLKIGIDAERRAPRIISLQSKFMSASESHLISKNNSEEDLLLLWSAKESLFKIMRTQEVDFKSHLHITRREAAGSNNGYLFAYQNRLLPNTFYQIAYRLYPRFVFTLCVEIPH